MATAGELLRPLLISKIRGIKRSVMLLAKATGHVVASVSRQKEAIRANPAHNHRIDTVGCFNHMYLDLTNSLVSVNGLLEHYVATSRANPAVGETHAQTVARLKSAREALLLFENLMSHALGILVGASMELSSGHIHNTFLGIESTITTLMDQQSLLGSVIYYMEQVQSSV